MPDFFSYLVAAFWGFASGFLVSIPVGPINISIVNEGARRGFGWAFSSRCTVNAAGHRIAAWRSLRY